MGRVGWKDSVTEKRTLLAILNLGVSLLFFAGLVCSLGSRSENHSIEGGYMELKVTSQVFEEGGMIPRKYTCDGEDVSPPLAWTGVPDGAKTIALINDDPDAPMGTWVHWVLFNLPADVRNLAEAVPPEKELPSGAKQGRNDFRRIGYGGPCPPGGTHRYYFKFYALDQELNLAAGATKADLLKAMQGHILAEGQLMGKYRR